MAEQATKPARKRTTTRKVKGTSVPEPAQVAVRAYFIYLDEGSTNEVDNWLRAERELGAA